MLRIPRQELDAAVAALQLCAARAENTEGVRIEFRLSQRQAEAVVLGALSIVAPNGGPVSAKDVFFVAGFGTENRKDWPPAPVPPARAPVGMSGTRPDDPTALPRWKSHKIVQADKIISAGAREWRLECGLAVMVSLALINRCDQSSPIGGYYVLYEDGFESWSPAKAFEEGYTRIMDNPTIEELEQILKEPDAKVNIRPDGTIEQL